jgi:hypothetical protein
MAHEPFVSEFKLNTKCFVTSLWKPKTNCIVPLSNNGHKVIGLKATIAHLFQALDKFETINYIHNIFVSREQFLGNELHLYVKEWLLVEESS